MSYKLIRFFATCALILHTLIPNAGSAVGGGVVAYVTEETIAALMHYTIEKIADGAESIFPGSGKQTVYETADIINITLSYTQAGRALSRIRYGNLDSALKGALSTGRWLPQRLTTPWDRLVPTPLHTWTDAFFPQLQPQLALASGGLGGGKTSGLLLHNTQKPTTFKMDSGLPSSKGKVDIASGTTPQLSTVGKVDTAPKPTPQIKKITNDSAKNVVNSVKLKAKLAFQEAGILDQHGKLTPKAIGESRDLWKEDVKTKSLKPKKIIKNPQIIKQLTKDGSHIEDWSKFATKSVSISHIGEGAKNSQKRRIHFYMNKKTGKVDYKTVDFKVKDPVTNMPNYKKALEDYKRVNDRLKKK